MINSKHPNNTISNVTDKLLNLNLKKEIQEIKARLRLINYRSNDVFGNIDGNYSIYELKGISGVNKVYEYEINFVSNEKIEVEEIIDTDVEIVLEDLVNYSKKKKIYGKICKAIEDSVVGKKYMYKIVVVHPIYYLGLSNKYEIFHNQTVSHKHPNSDN